MEDIQKEREWALRRRLLCLEDERYAAEHKLWGILEEEEEEEIELQRTGEALEQMWDSCPSEDREMQQLMEEKQHILSEFKGKKIEFYDACYAEIERQRREMQEKEDEIYQQISEIRNEYE